MKTIFDDGRTSILLNEETGIISLVRDGLICSSENEGVVVSIKDYKGREILLEKKPELFGKYTGGLGISFHCGSRDWTPGRIERQ
ncbi:MAG: hypothetical protein PHN69_00630 [Candidatus Pacebacteria bacterium]|nr:hypothetical protein [Candidatus Paceibacterota bacterium]